MVGPQRRMVRVPTGETTVCTEETPEREAAAVDAALARTSDRLRRLLHASRRLGSTLDPTEIYESLVSLLHEAMPFDGLVVSSFDPQTKEIRCQYAWVEGERPDPSGFPPLRLGREDEGMQSRVIRTGLPYLFTDVEQRVRRPGTYYEVTPEGEAEPLSKAPDEEADYRCTRSAMMAPIILDGVVLGVVQLMCMQAAAYSQDDLEFLEAMVLQMGAAARNAALYEKAQREVSERAKAQAYIEELNRRLQRAMAETHHRVKNNLQILAALVDLELSPGEETVSRSSLQRINLQIQSLATLHDLLTHDAQDDDAEQTVSVRAAMEKLVSILRTAAGDRTICLETADLEMPVRQCTSFTLLVSELVSNAVKHGAGKIDVRLSIADASPLVSARRHKRCAVLEVEDEGPGFPPGFDAAKAANTGLELIDSLGRWDLNGRLEYCNRPQGGARVQVTFPLADA